ncbi:MAG: hypothetical protein PVG08_06680 [Desulfobacterales bacterium]|jgi:tetratricopeptide (TPR) repeat protein
MNALIPHIRSLFKPNGVKPEFEIDRVHLSIGIHSSLALFLFAFVFRLVYIIQSADNPLFGVPVVDAYVYNQWAQKMVDGVWLWDHVDNYLPIYPAFLAIQQIVFGPHPIVNKILQSMMGALSAVLMAQIAARAWNRQVGMITGYLMSTNWMLVIFESEKFAEPFCIFFFSLTLWILAYHSHHLWAIFGAGFTFALSAGVRANLFLMLPIIPGWLVWKNWQHRSLAIRAALIFCVGTVIIIGAIVYRNYQVSGAVMLRAQATWSLYSGLSPEFEGLHPPAGILFRKYMYLPQQAGKFTIPDIEVFWAQKLGHLIRNRPFDVFLNFFRRAIIFLNAREWSQELDVYAYRAYSKFLSLPWTGFWLVGPLGLMGLFLTRRLSKLQCLLIICTIIGIASILPFKVSDRYRLPTAALLTFFAALTLRHFYFWFKTKNKHALSIAMPILAILCLICWPDWQNLAARKTSRHHFFIGKWYETIGQIDDAIQAYETSMQAFSWDPDSPYRIGRLLILKGERERALLYLKEALRREPKFPGALNEIARIHLDGGNLEAAEQYAIKSLNLAPAEVGTLILMSDIQRRRGNHKAELAYLKRAVTITGNHRPTIILAERLEALGEHEASLDLYGYIMKSRMVDKAVRVSAAMKAGLIVARHFHNNVSATIYWEYIIEQFLEFRFFVLQAEFFMGALSEESFRKQMGSSSEWRTAAEYVIGLKHWLNGHMSEAVEAYQRCLQIASDQHSDELSASQKWAQEDLKHIRETRLKSEDPG